MRLSSSSGVLLLVLGLVCGCSASRHQLDTPPPQRSGELNLGSGVHVVAESSELAPLVELTNDDLFLLTGIHPPADDSGAVLRLRINDGLAEEGYRVTVGADALVEGGSYRGVSNGLVALLKSVDANLTVTHRVLSDAPAYPYRGVMLDLARAWHDVSTIKDVITMARWSGLNTVHLHLTDDQAFTFPSTAYPQLATEGHSYTLDELADLNAFAQQRGVTLVPEIDVPGHASKFVQEMPELFGIGDPSQNPYTISMGKESVYDALDTLIGELAEAFPHSPYIHIGGDEAFFAGMDDDPETVAYMAAIGIPNVDELFRHFLTRLNTMVRQHNRQTIVWSGFGPEGEIEIPRDIIVMAWEPQYYDPQQLLDDGFPVINASFKPLYVVNNRTWEPEYILSHWNPRRWESWATDRDTFMGSEVRSTDQILGASMSAWEQDQTNQVPRLRQRVPAMNAHLWNAPLPSRAAFHAELAATNPMLSQLLRPFTVSDSGLTFPNAGEGLFLEHRWFASTATATVHPQLDGLTLHYTLDGTQPTMAANELTEALSIASSSTLTIQAFDATGEAVGTPYRQRYLLRPITAHVEGLWKDLPPGSWEKHRFEDELTISFTSSFPDHTLRVTLDGSRPDSASSEVTGPISFDETTTVRAQLFDDTGEPLGLAFSQTYYQIVNRPSLTTGRPILASNEALAPGRTRLANDGRVTLWEQWGGHVGEHVWVRVDLEQPETIRQLEVYNFWDGRRYYQYTIDGSLDVETWTELVDFRDNTAVASIDGYIHEIAPTEVRYLRINLLFNSANPGLHLVEFSAFH